MGFNTVSILDDWGPPILGNHHLASSEPPKKVTDQPWSTCCPSKCFFWSHCLSHGANVNRKGPAARGSARFHVCSAEIGTLIKPLNFRHKSSWTDSLNPITSSNETQIYFSPQYSDLHPAWKDHIIHLGGGEILGARILRPSSVCWHIML